jgi:peptidoglycan/LPS O-acetylase OafA/YrhL
MTHRQLVAIPTVHSQQTNTVDALLVLRAFACLMVVVIHCSPPAKVIQVAGMDLSWLLFSHGFVAVWIFFTLSGYLMGKAFFRGRYSYSRAGIQRFWGNRALRIIPLYAFSVVLLSIFVYPEILKPDNWATLLRILTFTYQANAIADDIVFNGAMWSLSTEVQFYVLVPLLYGLSRGLAGSWRRTCGAIVVVIFGVFALKCPIWLGLHSVITTQMPYALKYWYSPLPTNLDVFMIGFLLNPLLMTWQQRRRVPSPDQTQLIVTSGLPDRSPITSDKSDNKSDEKSDNGDPSRHSNATLTKRQLRLCQVAAVCLMLLFYLFTSHHFYFQERWGVALPTRGIRTSTTFFLLQPLTAIVTALFIAAFEIDAAVMPPKLTFEQILKQPLRIFEVFGYLSYGVYIWHSPIIYQTLPPLIPGDKSLPLELFYQRLSIVLLLSSIFAAITYWSIELPALRWKWMAKPTV